VTSNSIVKVEILDNIPIHLDPEVVAKKLHLDQKRGCSGYLKDIQELLEIANFVIEPKAIYQVLYVDNKNKDTVDIGGVRFTSRILRINLDKIGRVFPYIVTIGRKLEDRADSFDDLFKKLCLDEMGDEALGSARQYLADYLKRKYKLGQISIMSPGSLEDWPLTQQKQLFSLFGNVEDLVGVRLTESCLMIPRKSVSGIYFPTEVKFYSCQLCPRKGCKQRRAPYDIKMVERCSSNLT